MSIQEQISLKKAHNKRIKNIRAKAAPLKCPICQKRMTSTCNSHSVPRMILKTISKDGYLYNKNMVDQISFFDSKTGVNSTGTFHYICRFCDNNFFCDYENPKTIHDVPSNKVLTEIAIKNILQKMQAKAFEIAFFKYDQIITQKGVISDRESAIKVFELDYRDYDNYLKKFIKIKDIEENKFRIIFRKVLPYEVPIATQECFTIYKDRKGNEINSPNLDENQSVQVAHLCVFPYEGRTTILLFYYEEDSSYDILREQFSNSSEEENLKYINYYMLSLGENYFYSTKLKKKFFEDPVLKKISREYIGQRGNFGIISPTLKKEKYVPVKYNEVPFILESDNSLNGYE